MNIVRNIFISIAALCPALVFSQTSFYVSSKGNEANPGTKTRPFASINRALMEVRKTHKHSVCGKLLFVDPQKGDFRLKDGAPALSAGFKNFAMDSFGVVSPKLKALAKKVQIPTIISLDKAGADEIIDFIGAKIKNLNTAGERSAKN